MSEMNKETQKWSYYLKVLTTYFPYLIVMGVFQVIGFKILGLPIEDAAKEPILSLNQHIVIMASMTFGIVIFLYLIIVKLDKENFKAIGLDTQNGIQEFFFGLGIGTAILSIGTFIMVQIKIIGLKSMQFDIVFLAKSLLLFLLIAFAEEIFFRGYVLRLYLKAETNKHSALVFSALLFGMSHSMNPNITNFGIAQIVIAGLLLGINYMYTQRIWFGLGLHISWNFVQAAVFGYPVSGMKLGNADNIIYINKNELLNGGEFGFEGSVFAMILQVIVFIALLYYYENHFKKPTKIADIEENENNS
jgi:uncharacterized protein